MPYKPTGRPNGRPRKNPAPAEEIDGAVVQEAVAPATRPMARKRFRMIAQMLNPSPFVQVRDGRGRPRRTPRHTSVKA